MSFDKFSIGPKFIERSADAFYVHVFIKVVKNVVLSPGNGLSFFFSSTNPPYPFVLAGDNVLLKEQTPAPGGVDRFVALRRIRLTLPG